MGGAETTGTLVKRPLLDARRAPPGVATRTAGEGSGGGSGGVGIYVGSRGYVERYRGQERGQGGGEVAEKMGDGGGSDTYIIQRRRTRVGGDLEGGGTDIKRGGGGDYRDIGIMEVVLNAVAVILNHHFTAFITYHDSLHGLRAGRSTGTAILEVKLIQLVAELREAVLRAIFLDLKNAYNALDRSRCLDILEGFGVGPRALHLLRRYWGRIQMVERAGGYHV